ncbi:MAG: RNA polymerase sigma factor [Flavisolibacter sp.]
MISTTNSAPPEREIIMSLQAGGSQRRMAEKQLYEHYFYLIKHGCSKYSIAEEDASSAYSDTIIGVIENIVNHKFEGRSTLKSYVFQVFFNKCVDLVRKETTNKNKVHVTTAIDDFLVVLPDKTKSVVQQMIDKHQRSSLYQKLEEIGEKCKQILLFFEDGYTDREIAEFMNYNSSDVVKTSRLRCLEKLRQKMLNSTNQS